MSRSSGTDLPDPANSSTSLTSSRATAIPTTWFATSAENMAGGGQRRTQPTCTQPLRTPQRAILAAVDAGTVLAAAASTGGDYRLALHVIDLVAMAPGDTPDLVAARELKAHCCDILARQTKPFVSRSLCPGSARRPPSRLPLGGRHGLDAPEASIDPSDQRG
ncbi:MAG: hypothetical protein R2706_06325 [Acidimicrobiales bacterium]